MGENGGNEHTEGSEGYVHDPERFRRREKSDSDRDSDGPRTTRAYVHDDAARDTANNEFGARGWGLVAALLVAFVAVPATILYIPYSGDVIASLGLTYRDAYLVLPLLPALGLGALAVWVAVGSLSR
ncbi:hypothetical protein [Halomarina litorea]|uniref:hypothetical protein n=1 Tax=Halomarina litorea TaxID=2961595 RepID=UPI0020C51587|nr:hypothetical protein [Halomarina sp. BCD28]